MSRNMPPPDPLIEDILAAPGTTREVRGLARIFERYVRPTGRRRPVWLEPACGTGRYLRAAAARGIRVTGFDKDPPRVAFARERLSGVRYGAGCRVFVARMESFADGLRGTRADFAFNLGNTVRLLPSDRALIHHLREMGQVLGPKGVYVVGISLTHPDREETSEDFWEAARGRIRVQQLVQYLPPTSVSGVPRREKVISETLVHAPGETREHRWSYNLRTYDESQWLRVVEKSGWQVLATVDQDGEPLDPKVFDYAIWILRPAP